ncbi:MAG: hypothetical protein GX620_01885 [Chloroflexi bacterium]|nr:hypothetical protein [Chloroflexota bacterium]
MVDLCPPVRSWLGLRDAAGGCRLLLVALALSFLFSLPAHSGSRFDAMPLATPARSHLFSVDAAGTAVPINKHYTYLPLISQQPVHGCPTNSTAEWDAIQPSQSNVTGAATSPDLNLNVRGWNEVDESLSLVRYPYPPDEPPDRSHPLFLSAVAGSDGLAFISTNQLNDWDWLGCNCAVPRPRSPYPVTLLGLRTTPGQPIHIARRDLPVDPVGLVAMVMYADAGQLALKYAREDRVDTGYLVHLSNLCVDPNLLALYERLDSAGRHWLPGVSNDSIVGTAWGSEVRVSVRDSGSFLDPRSWQDWWQDQPPPAMKGEDVPCRARPRRRCPQRAGAQS